MTNPSDIISGHTIAFDHGIAIECGINAAIIYNNIIFWLRANKDKPDSFKEGKVWMYQTQEKMAEFFQFFSIKETKNAIKILLDAGLLVKKNFNKNHFDQTNWYSLSDECYQKVFTKVPKRPIDDTQKGPSDGAPPGPSDGAPPGPCIKEDKEEDKKIQIPAAEPVNISFTLKELKIPDTLKMQLTKNHDEAYLELLAKRVIRWKGRADDVSAVKFIQSKWDDWTDYIPPDEQRQLNLDYLNSLRHLDNKTISHNKISVGAEYIEFSTTMTVDTYEIDNKNFIPEVQEILTKLKNLSKGKQC